MLAESNVRQLQRRVYASTIQDGLTEIFVAIMLFTSAGILADPKLLAFLGLLLFLLPVAINRLKRRITYPRMGYVELADEPPQRLAWGMFAFTGVVFAAMALLLLIIGRVDEPAAWRKWAPLFAAAAIGGGIHYAAKRSGLARLHVFQVISLTTALVICLAGTGASYAGVQIYCLIMATIVLFAGLFNLVRFLHRCPVRGTEDKAHVNQ